MRRFRGRKRLLLVAVATLPLGTLGCGHRTTPDDSVPKPAQVAELPLPEWAPENPSPEFLRAARVLKPIPEEALLSIARADKAAEAMLRRAAGAWPAAYEFFGTLTDGQIERFLSAKEIAIPVKSLTPEQRDALDNWFEVWRKVMNGLDPEDYLIVLYKMGAEEDLSNVRVGFIAHGGHAVHIAFWVTPPGGEEDYICTWFANI